MRTIALFASSRRDGNTGKLLDRVAGELGIDVVDLAQLTISAFDYEHRNRGDAFEPLMERVLQCDHIIFASPEYWYAVSPPMKIFLDRISDYLDIPELLDKGRRLRGKTAYVVCTSVYEEPSSPFLDAFKKTFDYLGMVYGGCLHANCKSGYAEERHGVAAQKFVAALRTAQFEKRIEGFSRID